jgi:sulfonate transport system substrate-binding protein
VLADGAAIHSENAVVLIASRGFTDHHLALLQTVWATLAAENGWSLTHQAEAGAIWAQQMNLPAEFAPALGENDAVPTTAVTPADTAQIEDIARWYVASGIVPRLPDVAAGVVTLK